MRTSDPSLAVAGTQDTSAPASILRFSRAPAMTMKLPVCK